MPFVIMQKRFKMTFSNWLKYFFGSFFLHRYASESEERGFGGVMLGIALAMAMIFAGLFGGSVASFPSYYHRSAEYTQFLYNAFAEGEDRLSVTVKDGTATAAKFGEAQGPLLINTFENETDRQKYSVNGYQLIVDTRPAKTTYDDFKVEYKKGDITLDHNGYLSLTAEQKREYTIIMEFTADSVEFTPEKVAGYVSWLLEQNNAEAKKECEALLDNGVAPESNYNSVYELYFKYCYPELARAESYGKAPTMRTYYLNTYMQTDSDGNLKCDKYLIILSDIAFTYFRSDDGYLRGISSFLSSLGDVQLAQSQTPEQAKAEVDGFFISFNKASASMLSINYLINLLMILLYSTIAWMLIAIIGSGVGRMTQCPQLKGFVLNLKSSGAFFLISGLIAFAFDFGMSFVLTGAQVYYYGLFFFVGVLGLRSLLHMAICVYRFKKEGKSAGKEDVE